MADAHSLVATTQLGATSLQSENRQGNRKRKQNMPSPAAYTYGANASSTVNQEPYETIPQVNTSKNLSASTANQGPYETIPQVNASKNLSASTAHQGPYETIPQVNASKNLSASTANHGHYETIPQANANKNLSASTANQGPYETIPQANANKNLSASTANQGFYETIPQVNGNKNLSASILAVISFNIPEKIVRSCALEMIKSGKLVNSATLLEECELRCQAEVPQLQSYSERLDSARNIALSEDEPKGAFSPFASHSSQYASPPLTYPLVQSCSEHSQSPSVSSFSSTNNHHSSSRHINGFEQSQSRRYNTMSHLSSSPVSYISSQSRKPSDVAEDCVDGCILPSLCGVSEDIIDTNLQSVRALSSGAASSVNHVKRNEPSSASLTHGTASTVHAGTLNGLKIPSYQSLITGNMISNQVEQNSGSSDTSHPDGFHVGQKNSVIELSNTQTRSNNIENHTVTDSSSDNKDNVEHGSDIQERTPPRRESLPKMTPLSHDKALHLNNCFKLVEKEHALLEKSRMCKLCLVKPRDVTFLPCGHFSVCRRCAEPTYVCPSCNKTVLATVDTYLS